MGKELPIDPKYINVPNICFSLTEPDDRREPEFAEQRKTRGFDDTETWALAGTIAQFVLPRLKCFREASAGMPFEETEKSWNKKLDAMITAFELVTKDRGFTDDEGKAYTKGMRLFAKWFRDLWW